MAVNSVLAPYPSFFDAAGDPLESGFIYIGAAGFEARSTPKASFFDVAQTIPTGTASGAAIRTKAGFPVNTSNAPAMFYVDGDFSISVCDRNGVLLYSALNMTLALNVGASVGPVLWADGNLGAVGGGFANEANTGFVRPSAGVMQTVVNGVLVSQQSATGSVFSQPVSGTGFVSGVAAALDADLTALAGIATNGILARTGAGTAAARTITAGVGVTVANGDGVAGNPTISAGMTYDTPQATTSGTAFDFTSVPSGVQRITVFFDKVSLSGTNNYLIQIGTGGSFVTAGYESVSSTIDTTAAASANETTGFVVFAGTAVDQMRGSLTLTKDNANQWSISGTIYRAGAKTTMVGGQLDLAGVLDRVRITRIGANTFDAGAVNIAWE